MRFIILDTETTGLDVNTNRIIEIGAVELINSSRTGRTYQQYINPEIEMSEESMKITKINNNFLKNKPKFHEISEKFLNFLEDGEEPILVAHNIKFDLKFLNMELKKSGQSDLANFQTLDTMVAAKIEHSDKTAKLDAICERMGINLSDRKAKGHGALLDSELLTDVFINFFNQNIIQNILDAKQVYQFARQEKKLEPRKFLLL